MWEEEKSPRFRLISVEEEEEEEEFPRFQMISIEEEEEEEEDWFGVTLQRFEDTVG